MHFRSIRRRQGHRGQASIEMGFAIVFLVMLLLGLVDVGYLLHHSLTLENAAWQGLRLGIMGHPDAQIMAAVQNAIGSLEAERLSCTITPPDGHPDRVRGGDLSVDLSYDDHPPLPVRGIFEDPFTLHTSRKGKIL